MLNLITKAMQFMAVEWPADMDKKLDFLKTIVEALEAVLWPILIVVASVGSIYAIYLGINMAKAEDAGKRDEAKKRVINAVIAMVVTVVLILLIQLVLIPNIPNWVGGSSTPSTEETELIMHFFR